MRVTSPAVTIKDIWDAIAASYVAAGSFGKLLNDYLDAPVSGAKADLTTLETRLSAARAGYLDNLNQAGLLQLTAARAGYLDELAAANLPTDVAAILADVTGIAGAAMRGTDGAALAANYTAARATKIDDIGKRAMMTASDTLLLSDDAEVETTSATYVKKKEVLVLVPGTWRIKFDLKCPDDAAHTAFGQIYLNGAAYGTQRTTVSTGYSTYSEDLEVGVDDLVQLYLKNNDAGFRSTARNFRFYGTLGTGVGVVRSV